MLKMSSFDLHFADDDHPTQSVAPIESYMRVFFFFLSI